MRFYVIGKKTISMRHGMTLAIITIDINNYIDSIEPKVSVSRSNFELIDQIVSRLHDGKKMNGHQYPHRKMLFRENENEKNDKWLPCVSLNKVSIIAVTNGGFQFV